jgi:hypothetical protein
MNPAFGLNIYEGLFKIADKLTDKGANAPLGPPSDAKGYNPFTTILNY